jgi:hypothetical protein
LEGVELVRKWATIAKAEFYVMTSKFRRLRIPITILIFLFGIYWSLYLVPSIASMILETLDETTELLLMIVFPQLMRSAVLFIWIMVLVFPISYALQEIKIGQWEIMLSNNVSTRDMMLGTFVGKIPGYGLLIVFMAPIVISPFALFFEVSIIGQAIMYAIILFVALSTLFLGNLVSTAIQSKLGESSRGDDLAKALGMVVAIIILIPMYGLMYFAGPLSEVMGMPIWILFPFTWGADLISWSIIIFNGIGLSPSAIEAFEQIFGLNAFTELALLLVFSAVIVALAFTSADRLYSFEAGARTEKITTVGEENFILRGIRKVSPSSFGVLLVTSLKDFGRKAQNLSRIAYGMILAIIFPFIMNFSIGSLEGAPPEIHSFLVFFSMIMMGMMLAMICGITFGGFGFLESKDQLWIFKSAPNGSLKFAKARVVESLLFVIPIVIIPSIIVSIILEFNILDFLALLAYTYWSVCGSVLFSIGITANNPAYENQKSSAFILNSFISVFGVMIIFMISLFVGIGPMIEFENIGIMLIVTSTPLVIIGAIVFLIGVGRMTRADIK